MDNRLLGLIVQGIEDAIQEKAKQVIMGNFNIECYKKATGEIIGLQLALEIMEDVMADYQQKD